MNDEIESGPMSTMMAKNMSKYFSYDRKRSELAMC